MARLIRTEKEVEGRFEEVWLVVDEDALEQWPAGPREVVGRPGARIDGARPRPRRGASTRPTSGCPGCCTRPCCARRMRTRGSKRIDLARCARGARRSRGDRPGRHPTRSHATAATRARRSRRSAPTRSSRRGRGRADRGRVGACSSRCSTPTRRSPAASCSTPRDERARRHRARARRGGRRRRGDLPHPDRAPQLDGDPSVGLPLGRRHARGVHLDPVRLGRPRRARRGARAGPPTSVRVVCEYMGGGFGSKNGPGDYTFIAAELARRTGRPVRCALTRREENTSPPATATRRSSGSSSAPAPTAR